MATTVEAKSSGSVRLAAAPTPWYRNPGRLAGIGAAALVALVLVAWLVVSSGKRKEAFAGRALNKARAAAEAGNLGLAASELQKLTETYRGTDAATEAVMTLNQVRMVNGQSELAAAGLREFLQGDPPRKYVAPAQGLLGAALENAKRWEEAAAAYTKAAEAADVPYLKAEYLISAGRAYRQAGTEAQAIAAYRTVVERYGDSPSAVEAKVRLAEVTAGKM
jgi:outer membrane protein assembly factor BamD (BamD/ComL family)